MSMGLMSKHRVTGGPGRSAYAEIVLSSAESDQPSLVLLRRLHQATPTPGEAVLGFVVDDVEQVVRAAEGAGGVVRSAPKAVPRAGLTVAQVEDPEGHLVELLQFG
jgi:lactoylglutathione lyase